MRFDEHDSSLWHHDSSLWHFVPFEPDAATASMRRSNFVVITILLAIVLGVSVALLSPSTPNIPAVSAYQTTTR